MAALAEFYSDLLGESVTDALAYKRAQRMKLGGPFAPFGYDQRGDRLYVNKKEQGVLRDIRRRRRELKWSYRRIAGWLNRRQVRTKSGKPWQPAVVRKLIERPSD